MSEQPWVPFFGDIPATIPYPDVTIYRTLEKTAGEHGEFYALDFLGSKLTYRRLKRHVDSAARALWALGARPGDRLALVLPNTPHVAVLLYAANRIGVVVSPLHPESDVPELESLLSCFEPQWLATTSEHADGLFRLIADRAAGGVIVCDYHDYARGGRVRKLNRLRQRYSLDLGGIRGVAAHRNGPGAHAEVAPMFSWSSFLLLGSDVEVPEQADLHVPDECAVVLWTNDTRGTPRGAMHADRQLTAAALQAQVQGPLLAGQTLVAVVPVSSGLGLGLTVHAVVASGATSVLVPHATSGMLARLLRKRQPEYIVGTPTTYSSLVMERAFRRSRYRSLMGAFCGGDRLPRAVRERFETIVRRRGGAVSIREGYGAIETVAACATMPDLEERSGSVGIPYPDTLVAIAKPASLLERRSEPPRWEDNDSLGEILVSGPTVMLGYFGDEEATLRALQRDDDGRLWLRTGDLGRMDRDGFLYFVERIGRAVAAGAIEIHPGLTELLLSEHAEVLETCVTVGEQNGAPELTAHVAPVDRDRDQSWLESHLREALQSLDRAQRPARFAFHERLPRTLSGVIDRRRLGSERGRL